MNNKLTKVKAIAIDGPSGAGKSTVAKAVAKKLGFQYIDTGAMYRAVTLKALKEKTNLQDEAAVTAIAENCVIDLLNTEDTAKILLDGNDVTLEIRSAEVTQNVSLACSYIGVREAMVKQQRAMAEAHSVVMDGRDIATNVLPTALLKIYLTASPQERGLRRYKELQEKSMGNMTLEEVVADLNRRDNLDSTRKINPLKQDEDALLINSDGMTINHTVDAIIKLWKGKE